MAQLFETLCMMLAFKESHSLAMHYCRLVWDVRSLSKEKLELEKSLQESATALISLKSEFNASERENANLREVNDINEKKIQEQNKSIEELNSKILELKN